MNMISMHDENPYQRTGPEGWWTLIVSLTGMRAKPLENEEVDAKPTTEDIEQVECGWWLLREHSVAAAHIAQR